MTDEQWDQVIEILLNLNYEEVHFGDCIGADADFFVILYGLREETKRPCVIHSHPSNIKGTQAKSKSDIIYPEKPPIERDKIIANRSDILIACTKGFEEEIRSGTWTTVRYARKIGIKILIVWPNGSVTEEEAKESRLE
jgi:hypothetical protein